MNTKKILAVSLAATTAFSMFGAAMSVGAAVNSSQTAGLDAYKSTASGTEHGAYTKPLVTDTITGVPVDSANGAWVISQGNKDVLSDVIIAAGKKYLFDYAPVIEKKSDGTNKYAFSDIETAFYNNDSAALTTALNGYYGNGSTPAGNPEISYTGGDTTPFRMAVVDKFISTYKAARDFFVNDMQYVDADNLYDYNIVAMTQTAGAADAVSFTDDGIKAHLATGLIGDILKVDSTFAATLTGSGTGLVTNLGAVKSAASTSTKLTTDKVPTSYMLYLIQEYDRVMDLITFTTSNEDTYYKNYERAMELAESDYTTWNWNQIQAYITKAEDLASKATTPAKWAEANTELVKVFGVDAVVADFAALKSILASLYTDGKIPATTSAYAGTGTCAYDINDFKVKGIVTDEWDAFAGNVKSVSDPEYVEGAYRVAHTLYRQSLTSQKKKIGQTQVDNAVSRLEAAIADMDPNYTTSDWAVLKLEEAVAKAEAKVETDYKTSTSVWKTFVKKLEESQALLEKSSVKNASLSNKADELIKATSDLATIVKAVPATTKTELSDLVKEGKKLLKDMTDKTPSQINALTVAVKDGENANLKTTISDYDALIAALETAIENYAQIQGWYQDGGKWFYGEGNGVIGNGWKQIGKTWFYFNTDGSAKQSEWFQIEGKWYYANSNCGLATGWAKVDGKWYFFKGDNSMKTGWEKVDGQWYYMNSSGAMVTGWAQIDGKYYYFSKVSNALGQMATNTTIDGYKIDANGVWVK